MATLIPMSKSWADLDEPGRYKLYRPCEKGIENCEACLELKQVEDQMMSGTTDAMDSGLLEHHREVRTRLNQAHDPLVHKVPVEITSYIFQLSMPPVPADNNLQNMKSVELQAPTILSAVCTAWRQLTLSTPQLWTFSKVSLSPSDRDEQNNRKFEDQCGFFHERLRRSGQLPLKICVTAWDSASYNPFAIGVVQAIALCCSRWQILDLDFRFCGNLSRLLLGKTYQAPNLQALRLNILHTTEPPVSIVARPKDVYLVGSLDKINLDWGEVTSVHLFKSYSSDCTKVLQLAPLLECCRFSQWPRSRDNSSLLNIPITHTRIQEVILEKLQRSRDTAPFLEEANFPALRSITFPGFPGLTRTVVGLIKRSCCSLQELVFTNGMYQQLACVLQEVPSLQRLICRTTLPSDRVNELIQLLSSRGDSDSNAAFFSQLEHIELTFVQADAIQWPLLAEMIRPLPEAAVRLPLHTVKIDITYNIWADHPPQQDIDSDTLRRLQDALKDGFNLRLNVVRGVTREKYDVFQAISDPSWKDITRQWYLRPVMGIRPLGSDEE